MQILIHIYRDLFPNTSSADWFFAFLGLFLHAAVKLKTVSYKQFRLHIFLEEFIIVWFISFLTITICLGTLPQVLDRYSSLDSALIGYSSSSLFRSLFKQKLTGTFRR